MSNQNKETEKKRLLIHDLWRDLSLNKKVSQRYKIKEGKKVNIGFVNQYALNNQIPNKWFDWEGRVDAKVMIIGQDWGPYSALKTFINNFEKESKSTDFVYDEFLFKTFSSRTEKFIIKAIETTFSDKHNRTVDKAVWDNFIFTVAVLFTRQGDHFRGSEFYDEKYGIEQSLPYLKRQLDVVQPTVIVPLGGAAWGVVKKLFSLNMYPEKISDIIRLLDREPIKIENKIIIPNFHPASHTDPKIQLEIWKTLWENFTEVS